MFSKKSIYNNYELMPKTLTPDGIVTNYRCDELTKIHSGKHILFLGDSFASGDGLDKEDTWCYKLYNKINKEESLSGYYNIGISSSSVSESIDQFFKYCYNYGNPDIVFFVITEFDRDLKYSTEDYLENFIFRLYFYLEQYCKSNNIQLYSFSWVKSINIEKPKKRYLFTNSFGKQEIRPLWTEQVESQYQNNKHKNSYNLNLLESFDSFYDYSENSMIDEVFKNDTKSNSKEKSLWSMDLVHPGTSFHEFYCDFMYSKYKEKNK